MKLRNIARLSVITFPTVMSLRDVAPNYIYAIAGVGAVMLLIIFGCAMRIRKPANYPKAVIWMFLLIVMTVVASVVAAIYGVVALQTVIGNSINIAAAVVLVTFVANEKLSASEVMSLLTKSLFVLLMTSNIFYLLGIEPAVDPWKFGSRSSMLSLIGIEGVRVEFPLTRGLVSHATLCGITAVTVWFSRESKLVKLATYFAAIFGILMTDGRSALFFTVFVIAYGQFFRFAGLRLMPIAFIATAPLYLIAIRAMPESILIMFSRSGDASELIAGSSRVIVWSRAFDFMSQNWVTAIFGAGQFGQLSTGIFGGEIARSFRNFTIGVENMTLHNAAMQIWIDSGLIGVGITLGFLSAVAGKLVRGKRLAGAPQASAVFSYIILVGAFSTYGTIYWDDGFYALVLVGCAALYCIPREIARRRQMRRRHTNRTPIQLAPSQIRSNRLSAS